MSGISKLVALVLMLAALAWPAATLSVCWTHADAGESGMKCPPGCPMMARQGDRVSAESRDGSCCKISSGKPAPASVPQSPVTPSRPASTPAKFTVPMPAPMQRQYQASSVEASAPDTSSQAVLCTFLI